jgi:hypothetical protein
VDARHRRERALAVAVDAAGSSRVAELDEGQMRAAVEMGDHELERRRGAARR